MRLLLPENHEAVRSRHTQAPDQTGTKVRFNSDIPETTAGTAKKTEGLVVRVGQTGGAQEILCVTRVPTLLSRATERTTQTGP